MNPTYQKPDENWLQWLCRLCEDEEREGSILLDRDETLEGIAEIEKLLSIRERP